MKKVCLAFLAFVSTALVSANGWASANLSEVELKWLRAAEPVLVFAKAQGLSIDIAIKPQSEPGDVPLAMGVRGGHCKLLLSMRGNPNAEATLTNAPVGQQALLIEAMAAHEVAHCWRYAHGVWHALPAGFVERQDVGDNTELAKQIQQMRVARREEGYADLLALAWTSWRHAPEYSDVYAWLERIRGEAPLGGGYHDTRVWLRLAKHAATITSSKNLFQQVQNLWMEGLRSEE